MDEFELIERVRKAAPAPDRDVLQGIGDDCAILRVPPGQDLIVTTDTLNADVHFAASTQARDIGHKALAVSLSDIASMGALPRWALLNLTLPTADGDWLQGFLAGFTRLAGRHSVSLVGGDTTRGPLSITATLLGLSEPGTALRRADARAGDRIMVSGTLGDAAMGLRLANAGKPVPACLTQALHRPRPRVELGRALAGRAHACIDLSDGILADLGHVAKASGCALDIELARLPTSPEVRVMDEEDRWRMQLAGGDDYELCFTIDPHSEAFLEDLQTRLELPLTDIGQVRQGAGVRCLAPDGTLFEPGGTGYDHFQQGG